MKRLAKNLLLITLFFSVIGAISLLLWNRSAEKSVKCRNIAVNRINMMISDEIAENGTYPDDILSQHRQEWEREYKGYAPARIEFIPLSCDENDVSVYTSSDSDSVICTVFRNGSLFGFVRYRFNDSSEKTGRQIILLIIAAVWLVSVCMAASIHYKIILPFGKLTDLPERLAKLGASVKLPESKSKYFGKFVWGMNMLSDVLAANTRKIHELENQRQTLLASIAHGIKTPVTNIRLYAEAIRTGLYNDSGDGSANNDIAGKIERNTEDIEKKITEMITTAATSVNDYEPVNERFYMKEITELIEREFGERLRISRVNYSIECEGNPMLCSDKYGIFRILSQFIENAVKYGDGSGLKISMAKQDEGFCFSVRNKGELLPAKEMPFIFGCYWRGSNSQNVNGSGIGLYAAKEIAHCLGGTVYAARHEQTSEMEFVLYLE